MPEVLADDVAPSLPSRSTQQGGATSHVAAAALADRLV